MDTISVAAVGEKALDSVIYACYPHPDFPTVSITGQACSLNCKHCNRRYLEGMAPCLSPESLFETCLKISAEGAKGVLLSGGYNPEGHVPFEPFLDVIEKVKRDTGIFISAHTGLAPSWLAKELGRAGVDLADFDLIGDDETIKLALGIEKRATDYLETMKVLKRFLPEVVPHICIGLHGGKLKGEFKAVEMAAEVNPRTLVFLVLTPTAGTSFENVEPPSVEDVVQVVEFARKKLPRTELALGCMRPKGEDRADVELAAIAAGVRRIVMPSRETTSQAERSGYKIKKLGVCCSAPPEIFGGEVEG